VQRLRLLERHLETYTDRGFHEEMISIFVGLPRSPHYPEMCNQLGQRYQGPVAIIIDALCYSTTDIFAAGFQDHQIGPLIGTSGNTGAGGANVWDYRALMEAVPDHVKPLPKKGVDARGDPAHLARGPARRRPTRGSRHHAHAHPPDDPARPAREERRPDRHGSGRCWPSSRTARSSRR